MVERAPETFAKEEHGHLGHFVFLHEDKEFGKFVHGAEPAGKENVDFGAHGEHDFSGEEIFELEQVSEVGVWVLFVREGDVEADGAPAIFVSAAVGGLHDAGAAAGDDGVAVLGKESAEISGGAIITIGFFEAGRAKDGDALRKSADDSEAGKEVFGVGLGTVEVGRF